MQPTASKQTANRANTMLAKYSSEDPSAMSSGTSRFVSRHFTAGEYSSDHVNSSSAISDESKVL